MKDWRVMRVGRGAGGRRKLVRIFCSVGGIVVVWEISSGCGLFLLADGWRVVLE